MDWSGLAGFSVSPVELIVRGSLVYLFLFAVFRVVLRRNVGSIGVADVLFIVIVADASQNAMAGEYRTVADGMVLVSTLVAWNVLIDQVGYRFPRLGKLLEPQPLLVVRNGRMLQANMQKEWLSRSELMSKLREQGIDKVAEVHRARMEGDGSISVITVKDHERAQRPPEPKRV